MGIYKMVQLPTRLSTNETLRLCGYILIIYYRRYFWELFIQPVTVVCFKIKIKFAFDY